MSRFDENRALTEVVNIFENISKGHSNISANVVSSSTTGSALSRSLSGVLAVGSVVGVDSETDLKVYDTASVCHSKLGASHVS